MPTWVLDSYRVEDQPETDGSRHFSAVVGRPSEQGESGWAPTVDEGGWSKISQMERYPASKLRGREERGPVGEMPSGSHGHNPCLQRPLSLQLCTWGYGLLQRRLPLTIHKELTEPFLELASSQPELENPRNHKAMGRSPGRILPQ